MELQLERIMNEQGRTQKWLSEQLGTTPQYAGQIVRGGSGATLAQYERIANILGIKLWQVFAPKEDYVLAEEHKKIVAQLLEQKKLNDRPDLIVVNRETGETKNYSLLEK